MNIIYPILSKVWVMFTHKRFKSWYWRTGMMVLAGFLDLVVREISQLNMPNGVTVLVGLVLGEISKHIYNIVQLRKKHENIPESV